MAELKLRSKYPDSLRPIIESAFSDRLHSIEAGIKRTKERLQEFETKYQLLREEFLRHFHNDELSHSFDFDKWMDRRISNVSTFTREKISYRGNRVC